MTEKPPEITWRTIDTAYQECLTLGRKAEKALVQKLDGQLLRDKQIVLKQLLRDAANAYAHATALVNYNGTSNEVDRAAASYFQIVQTPEQMNKLLDGNLDEDA